MGNKKQTSHEREMESYNGVFWGTDKRGRGRELERLLLTRWQSLLSRVVKQSSNTRPEEQFKSECAK